MTISTPHALPMSSDSQHIPVWKQFLTIPPPTRFITTVNAYIQFLQERGLAISARSLSVEASPTGSHSMLSGLTTNPKRQPELQTVQRVVDRLNDKLPSADRWPLIDAMVAADHRKPVTVHSLPANADLDYVPRAFAAISAPVMDVARIAEDGAGKSINPRVAVNFSSDMVVLIGQVPEYPYQREGELVLAQRPSNTDGIEASWALVRQGDRVFAKPRSALTRGEQLQVKFWLLGCMRFPSDDERDIRAIEGGD